MMMPFFEGNYFLHSLTNERWKTWYRQNLPENLRNEVNGQELLTIAGSICLRHHKFLRKFNGPDMENFLKIYVKYPFSLEVLDRIDEMSTEIFDAIKQARFLIFEEITDDTSFIAAIKQVQELYDYKSAEKLLQYLLFEIPKAPKGFLTQFMNLLQDKQRTESFLPLEPCMKTAFLKGREDLLSLSDK